MNTLVFTEDKQINTIHLSKITLIYGASQTGKTTLLDQISKAFSGTLPSELNGQKIKKNDYLVLTNDAFTRFSDEQKLLSKGILKKYIDREIEMNSDSIDLVFREIVYQLEKVEKILFQDSYLGKHDYNLQLKIESIQDLIKKVINIESTDLFGSSKNKAYDLFLKASFAHEYHSPVVLMVDDLDAQLDPNQYLDMIKYFIESEVTYVIATTRSPLFMYELSNLKQVRSVLVNGLSVNAVHDSYLEYLKTKNRQDVDYAGFRIENDSYKDFDQMFQKINIDLLDKYLLSNETQNLSSFFEFDELILNYITNIQQFLDLYYNI